MLKLRILIAAHTGHGGHRGINVTQASVEAHFWWNDMKDDIKTFVSSCLHCLTTASGNMVPRPLRHALHASKPNELLHFDYYYMMEGKDNYKYVLILKDDFSSYVWLKATKETTAEVTADYLIDWFSTFGVVNDWVSDRGSHFKNQLVEGPETKLSLSITLL